VTDLGDGDNFLQVFAYDPENQMSPGSEIRKVVADLRPAGDANGDWLVNISDAVFVIAYIFSGGAQPEPLLSADADCSGGVNISDAVYLIAYIFSGGPVPCEGD